MRFVRYNSSSIEKPPLFGRLLKPLKRSEKPLLFWLFRKKEELFNHVGFSLCLSVGGRLEAYTQR